MSRAAASKQHRKPHGIIMAKSLSNSILARVNINIFCSMARRLIIMRAALENAQHVAENAWRQYQQINAYQNSVTAAAHPRIAQPYRRSRKHGLALGTRASTCMAYKTYQHSDASWLAQICARAMAAIANSTQQQHNNGACADTVHHARVPLCAVAVKLVGIARGINIA